MHFPGPLAPHNSPLPTPPASLQPSFHRLLSTLSDNFRRPRQSSLHLIPFLAVSLFLRFFYLLSRPLITNFSLFSRNSRSSEQLFRADSSGFSFACSSPLLLFS